MNLTVTRIMPYYEDKETVYHVHVTLLINNASYNFSIGFS